MLSVDFREGACQVNWRCLLRHAWERRPELEGGCGLDHEDERCCWIEVRRCSRCGRVEGYHAGTFYLIRERAK
jgi:hypothetical protein